jgi:hypothetical protein
MAWDDDPTLKGEGGYSKTCIDCADRNSHRGVVDV